MTSGSRRYVCGTRPDTQNENIVVDDIDRYQRLTLLVGSFVTMSSLLILISSKFAFSFKSVDNFAIGFFSMIIKLKSINLIATRFGLITTSIGSYTNISNSNKKNGVTNRSAGTGTSK